ncbi:MAG TPA: hypothetical protein VL752_01720 [Acidisoma sp.]|uniref:hypothetical protein n=1 Tax=Acidisoma sp. TaxID=1872115 RepID=UPI002CDA87E3|nr:hypothetical protein [Acidisoma sp.]HTH99637.1 hypothetical protein [Acidisoma sp.]
MNRIAAAPPAYEDIVPYYAELCALSELRKKPGFGVPLNSGMGGHLLLYLNGVRVDRSSGYPVIEVVPPGADSGRHGVAISANSHYRNANWVAIEDRDFIFRGALAPGEALTREVYERTQASARERGLLDGIVFHEHFFRDKPPGMSVEDFKYEISVATDYGSTFGRNCYRARVPLDTPRMERLVAFLNELNEPYRTGKRIYHWRIFNDNCVHMAHNALAAAGFWAPWPTGQLPVLAAFRFPVPKNALVDLALRANDQPIENAEALFANAEARRTLVETGGLPTGPAALTSAVSAVAANDIYDVRRLRLIFYDNPFWGRYRGWFKRILSEPRYTDLKANLRHFAQRYQLAARDMPGPAGWARGERAQFRDAYAQYIADEAAKVAEWQASLDAGRLDGRALLARSVA